MVRLLVQKVVAGRRKGTSCVKPTRSLRRARSCRRYVGVVTLTRVGKNGANAVAFSGRITDKALTPGPYRLVVTAADAAGNRSKEKRKSFRILAPARKRARAP